MSKSNVVEVSGREAIASIATRLTHKAGGKISTAATGMVNTNRWPSGRTSIIQRMFSPRSRTRNKSRGVPIWNSGVVATFGPAGSDLHKPVIQRG